MSFRESSTLAVSAVVFATHLTLAAPSSGPASRPADVAPPPPVPLEIGAAAPDFDLPGVDGRHYKLADLADARVLAIVFTCNHCPTAQAYEARIKKLAEEFADRGVRLVAISPNDPQALRLDEFGYTDVSDSLEDMKIRAKQAQFSYPYLYDGETQAASRKYGPQSTPHVFIFDAQRKLRYRGRIDDGEKAADVRHDDARNAIEALLAGKPVPVETTKTFGCSIKWSDKRASVTEFMEKLAAEPVELQAATSDELRELRANAGEKLLLVNVWATWCGPCLVEMPQLVEANRMYRRRKFEFVTISMDRTDAKAEALRLLKQNQASNRNLIPDRYRPYELIEILDPSWSGALPYTMLIEPGGKVIYRKEGQIDPLELRQTIVGKLGRTY